MVFFILLLAMHTDDQMERAMASLVDAYQNAKGSEYYVFSLDEASRVEKLEKQVAELLDSNTSFIPAFCRRYVVEFRNEYEPYVALSVLDQMKSTHPTIAEAAATVFRTVFRADRVTIHSKRVACSVVAKNAGTMKPAVLQALFQGLPDELAMDLSSCLLKHLNRFPAEQRLEVLRIVLEVGKSKHAVFPDHVIEGATANEELYLEGLRKLTAPHHKALLILGLLEKDPKKYRDLETQLRQLAVEDKLSRSYYEKTKEINDWWKTDDPVERALARLVHTSWNTPDAESVDETLESSEHSSRLRARAAELLDANPRCIPAFCQRLVVKFQDEWELNVALGVLGLMESTHPTIAEAAATVFHTDRVTIHYKRGACSVVAKNAGALKPTAVQALFKGLQDKLAVSLSCSLLTHINRFPAEDRLEMLGIALEISKKRPATGTGLLGTITASVEGGTGLHDPAKYEELYLEGLKKFTTPHHKALLMMGLLEKDPKKYQELEAQLRQLAAEDKLSRWYYEKNKESNDWREENNDLHERK